MYKLLIVDDEDFEREGMAQMIDWQQYDIEMAGTAWNGVEALEKIEALRPDMILTDIKMPVMNGIELIQRVRERHPEIEFAVLSGFGEYEFTSQAMEQGVRHYILKPCDEDKIVETMEKVKRDVDEKRRAARREEEYLSRVAPQAQKQLFRNLLLDRERGKTDSLFRLLEQPAPKLVRLLVFRSAEPFDGLEEFALGNMLGELLEEKGERVYVSTAIRSDVALLLSDLSPEELAPLVGRVREAFARIKKDPFQAALSDAAAAGSLAEMYRQMEELFRFGEEAKGEPVFHSGMFDGKKQDINLLVDFDIVGKTQDYAKLLQSLQLTFLRMQKRGYTLAEKRERMDWLLRWLYGENAEADEACLADESGQSLMVCTAGQIWRHAGANTPPDSREALRYRAALEEIYRRFQDQELCLHYLAAEILYISEDYFGRFFQKMSGKKFTKFLLEARMDAAEKLMRLEPDIMVYTVSEMTGYAADGQYFSKTFKKHTGMTPSEYRDKVQLEAKTV